MSRSSRAAAPGTVWSARSSPMWWIIPTMRLVSYRQPDGTARFGRVEDGIVRALEAPSALAWLSGERGHETGEEHPLDAVTLLAPVPEPPSVRDFYAYEGHVATGWRKRGGAIPDAWYEAPAFYFANPASVHGPGEPIKRPEATRELDFELEIAAVLGGDGEIAGFTLLNDWSARDVQRREVTVGLGPAKGKDFALSIGPWLVTPDELPYEDGRLQIEATATVNGTELTRTNAADKHFSWPELVAHAGRDTRLRAGDVLGSGTLHRGCLLELGPLEGGRYLEPGDEVAISAEGLGTLTTPITEEQTYRRSASLDRPLEQRREHHLRLRPQDAGRVADPLERLLEVLRVPRVHVQDRARLAGDGVGRGHLGVPPGRRRGSPTPASGPRRTARPPRACPIRAPRGRGPPSSPG